MKGSWLCAIGASMGLLIIGSAGAIHAGSPALHRTNELMIAGRGSSAQWPSGQVLAQMGHGQSGPGMPMRGMGMPGSSPNTMQDSMRAQPMEGRMPGGEMGRMDGGMGAGRSMPGMSSDTGQVDLTDRLEGRLAFLRAELRITETQAAVWNSFAEALRSGRQHLLDARQQLTAPHSGSPQRLEQYEMHLVARLNAVKTARAAFAQLHSTLDEAQKKTADELIVPLIATF